LYNPVSNNPARNIVFLLLIPVLTAYSQADDRDAFSVALSNSAISITAPWHGKSNPALLSSLDRPAVSINYYNKYFIPELGFHSVSGSIHFRGFWGYSFSYSGNHTLNQSSVSISYGMNLFKWLDAGITLKGQYLVIEPISEERFTMNGNIGMNIRLPEGFYIGLFLLNPVHRPDESNTPETLSSETVVGVTYISESSFFLAPQLHWCGYEDLYLSFGAGYSLVPSMVLLSGFRIGSQKGYSYGVKFTLKKLEIILGSEVHNELGPSMAVSLNYYFKSGDHE